MCMQIYHQNCDAIFKMAISGIGFLNIHGYIGCLNLHRIHATANNFTTNRFENSILSANTISQTRKIFCITTYLETKSFKTVSK